MTQTNMAKLDAAIAKIRAAEDEALEACTAALAEAAVRHGIERMEFLFTTHLYRNGEELEDEEDPGAVEISAIEKKYLDEVHDTGFQAIWEKVGGWVGEAYTPTEPRPPA